MLGLCYNKTYGTMKNHNNGYDSGYNNRNKDVNDNDNDASGLGSDGPIFDPITMLWSLLGLAEEDQGTMMMVLRPRPRPRCPMYLRV